ncbi:AI-2E family transporter [Mucilaginibacter ginkgonis]|uniref:AI-2E family transporter n=1 Tax=Mucilaginibacter ginkgonis TaxID=2682091 RepID=A0A6I4I3V8_9SPHI|nr:AI-2E family transporter [Mucilaginibacter ginkgonis]QQL48674.1 AI-2E family transporter [Mucilaginibacter ginkgonis]
MTSKETGTPYYAKLAYVFTAIIGFGFLVHIGKSMLDPLMFGFLFAVLLLPLANFFEHKWKLPRSASAFLAIFLFVLFVGGIVYLVATQISRLADDWPMLKKQIEQSVQDLQGWVQSTFHVNMESQMAYVHNTTSKIVSSGTALVGSTFLSVGSIVLFLLLINVFTFLILFYRKLLFEFLLRACGDKHCDTIKDIAEQIQLILREYILGLLLEMFLVAAAACSVFWIIGIKYAALLGLITGLFNIIPYVGIFTALLLSTLITFATGALTDTFFVAISVIGIHAIDANFLLPVVVGSKVRLNALITFLGIILGEMLWGLSGMFLSIPTLAIIKIVFDHIKPLKPWGFLLGGDYVYKRSAERKMKTE